MSRVRANQFTDRAGSGAPTFPYGLTGTASTATLATNAQGLTGSPNITVNNITGVAATFSGNVSVGGTLTYEDVTNVDSVGLVTAGGGIRVTGGYSKLTGVVETVSAGTTYLHNGALVLELDVQNGTTYTYTNTGGNIGIVSFKNLPADAQNGTTITLIHTQNSSTPSGLGNTTAATGIGTNCTIVPYVSGSPITGISTRGLVGSATTVTLSETASDRDFVSFFVHYNGGTTSDLTSYKVYVTKNGGFRQGNVGV
jgi:hypothetical protein